MNAKAIVLVLTVVVLGGGIYYFLGGDPSDDLGNGPEEGASMDTSNVSGMHAEENMMIVSEQKPGASIRGSLIVLAAPGYLVIHEDKDGAPGVILGASALLPAGENSNVPVTLSRASRDGETLHAMLHFEKGEDLPTDARTRGSVQREIRLDRMDRYRADLDFRRSHRAGRRKDE